MLLTPRAGTTLMTEGYWHRVAHALTGRRGGVVLALTLVASAQILAQPLDFDLWTSGEVLRAWLGYAAQVGVIAGLLMLAFTLADEALPATGVARWAIIAVVMAAVSVGGTYVALAMEALGALPPLETVARGSLRWTALGLSLVGLLALHRRLERAREDLRAADQARAGLLREEAEKQLQLLQAQIEPHFLFNTLANVRRLYRTQPESGAQAIESLKRYLGAALPRIRAGEATLADEIELVRAYLELVRVRLGTRFRFEIEVEPGLLTVPFPPLLVMTLVENAVKHGIAPSARGGTIEVSARTRGAMVNVQVADDGLGIDLTHGSGKGVGLANVRRQLVARFGAAASLSVEQRTPAGVSARLLIPSAAFVPQAAVTRAALAT